MAALSAVASSAGLVAATGVAALGSVLGLAAVALAGAAAVYSAFWIYEQYEMVKDAVRPVSMLSAGGVTLAAALGMAVTAAPEPQQPALSKIGSASTALDSVRSAKVSSTSLAMKIGQAAKKSVPTLVGSRKIKWQRRRTADIKPSVNPLSQGIKFFVVQQTQDGNNKVSLNKS